jgi:sucrose-6-phosphate hydrolase SacC (GH32 family)
LITQTGNATFGVGNSYIQFNTSSFSGFYVNGGALLLPIELRSFTATQKGKKNEITWETASEKNLRVFQVERSSDAKNWTKIAEVTPNQAKNYSTEDAQPFALTYYRLISLDTDGQMMVSKIVSVEHRTGKLNIANVFPNPTSGALSINFENIETGSVQLFVTDLLGRQILTSSIEATEGMNTTSLDLSNIAAGTYFITLDNGVSKITKRVVKQ